MTVIRSSSFVFLALAGAPALAQERSPAATITKATWLEYSREYPQSPLCGKDEITLWSCATGEQIYSLCSSQVMSRTTGYMQYRAASAGKTVFTYPAEKKSPLGSFVYSSSSNGDASVEFSSNGYRYTLSDPLREVSSIQVSAPAPSGKQTEIRCGGNQTLQVNYTMRLMYDSGVWTDY